ncbi:class I SAM-dependent methyltransferase [Actinomycetospora sp. OC33-EN08]|uniref:Class I SAM-dependent methyltransferase n=1 Tax=Actinomycetospora aurantiaca TaxID=3129233 RepID=A0ABU8MFW6_9PSEU
MSDVNSTYSARTSYADRGVVDSYEEHRFSGALGRYRWRREQNAVSAMLAGLPGGLSVLDVPCGIGRWWPLLATKAASIEALDVSPAMLQTARTRVDRVPVDVAVREGNAESLEYPDDEFDLVFSHALTKHLPIPIQYAVMGEFARVSREWVVCSFGVFDPVNYQVWKRLGLAESYPLLPEQFRDLCGAVGLRVVDSAKCTTPVGVERSFLLRKASDVPPGDR